MAIRLDEARLRLLKMYGGLSPSVNNTYDIGTSSLKFANIYATTFHGSLNGNANTATKATQDSDGNTIKNTYLKLSGGTMTGTLVIDNGNRFYYSFIRFNAAYGDTTDAELRYHSPYFQNTTLIPRSQFVFCQYSYDSSSTPGALTRTNQHESYTLPMTETDLKVSKSYSILTSKSAVTIKQGGTGTSTAPTQGGVIYASSTSAYASTAAGSSGQLLQSAGTDKPTWITATNSNTASTVVKRDESGNFSAGTINATLNGNAATATKATQDSDGNTIKSTYLKLSGGTMTGQIKGKTTSTSWISATKNGSLHMATAASNGTAAVVSMKTSTGAWSIAGLSGSDNLYFVWGSDTNYNAGTNTTSNCYITSSGSIYGAVWNDYAEFRESNEQIQPGRVVIENGDDTLSLSSERLQPGANIVSDTYGFAIGETSRAQTPIAVSGRVLAYPYEPRDTFSAGDAVCSGPIGTVSKMTREEIIMYPERIIGTVSAIPEYKTWGSGNVEVDGRIWIRVR